MLRRSIDYIRAYATLQLPMRSIADLYTEAPPLAQPIPNVVYHTWVEQRLGRSHARELRRFREMNPEYTFEFFDTERMDEYMRTVYADHPILEVYENVLPGPAQTDIWRYAVLYDRGGVYFDINKMIDVPLSTYIKPDTRGLVSLETVPSQESLSDAVLAKLEEPLLVLNWALAFEPGHAILGGILDQIVEEFPRHRGVVQPQLKVAIVHFTGPHALSRAVSKVIDGGGSDSFDVAGVYFDGHGIYRIHASWVRYLQRASYRKETDVVMAT